jgi:hypothetical protein
MLPLSTHLFSHWSIPLISVGFPVSLQGVLSSAYIYVLIVLVLIFKPFSPNITEHLSYH